MNSSYLDKEAFDKIEELTQSEDNYILRNSMTRYSFEFMLLDMMGLHPDSLSNKNLFSNQINDIHHSFYAAHCDYFVSNEKELLKKITRNV